mgnify:FL=1
MTRTENQLSASDIYDDVRKKLLLARFQSGDKMKPEHLRNQYNCAASTMREVLFRLACDGFLSFQEQRGFRVAICTPNTLRDLTKMRILLETEGARLSMLNGDIEWEARLSAAHHKLAYIEFKMGTEQQTSLLVDVWSKAEWEFHETLMSACGSAVLREQHHTIYDRFRQHLLNQRKHYGFRRTNHLEHHAIVDAAMARDAELCKQCIIRHLEANLI